MYPSNLLVEHWVAHTRRRTHARTTSCRCTCVCMYVYMYICTYVCMYVGLTTLFSSPPPPMTGRGPTKQGKRCAPCGTLFRGRTGGAFRLLGYLVKGPFRLFVFAFHYRSGFGMSRCEVICGETFRSVSQVWLFGVVECGSRIEV